MFKSGCSGFIGKALPQKTSLTTRLPTTATFRLDLTYFIAKRQKDWSQVISNIIQSFSLNVTINLQMMVQQ